MYNINYRPGCLSIEEQCLKAAWKIATMTQACLLSFATAYNVARGIEASEHWYPG